MKKILFGLASLSFAFMATAQLKIDNAVFFISAGATVTVQGDVTSNVDIQGTGLLQLKGSTLQNVNMGGFTIPNLEVDNTNNVNLTGNAMVANSIALTNGKLILNSSDLRLDAPVTAITGGSSSRFIVTNGTGRVLKRSLGSSSFAFPVGFSLTEFNPLTIANSGTVDSIGVRCMQNVLDQGLTGSPVTADFANNSWVVTEATAGGSNLTLTGEWIAADELSNFNRVKSGIARYNTGTDWDLPASNAIAASGSGPYSRSRSGVTSSGVFAVADLEKVNAARLNLKVFLQGPYNVATGSIMNDGLRVNNLIPTTQPYSAVVSTNFTRVGVYDGSVAVNETVPSTSVFDVAGTNDDIVDWIYVSLNDVTVPTTKLQTRAALLQRDGDVVEYDITSGTYVPLRMPIDADGNYNIEIGHRNHLSIRTSVSVLLQDNVTMPLYNFSTSQAQARQNGAILTNPAMKSLGSGVFGLWAGNVNSNVSNNNKISFFGLQNDAAAIVAALGGNQGLTLNSYSFADINMDGFVKFSGLNNDAAFLVAILGGNQGAIFTQH